MTKVRLILIILSVIVGIGIVFGGIELIKYSERCETKLTVDAKQVEDSQNILVEWETDKIPDSLSIELRYKGIAYYSVTLTNYQVMLGHYEVPAFYGKQEVVVEIEKGMFNTSKSVKVDLFIDKYVIAPITATMPVTLFTLSLNEITDSFQTPTFVWFKRSGVWDYSQMRDNMHIIPVLGLRDLVHDRDEADIYKKVSAWVKELYEINPTSRFDFYYNDYFAYGWMEATIANEIPASNYKVTLLSDGTASFASFNNNFADVENYDSAYESMKTEYDKIKTQLATNRDYIRERKALHNSGLREYAYVMAKEESNVSWWLTRVNGTLAPSNPTVYQKVEELVAQSKIQVKDLKTLLETLSQEEQNWIKALYNFSNTMFEEAEKEEKEAMVILGTWTENEYNFDNYVNILQKLYGDEYVFYYKGHPKNPTNSESGKKEKLEKMGLIDIDSTIPAELIFFFNPEAFASGYQSSTFLSIVAEKSVALFNVRKASFAESYKDNMDIFMSKVATTDADYGSLVSNNNSFVIEFKDVAEYDIAIYNDIDKSLTYYKHNGTSYEVVE